MCCICFLHHWIVFTLYKGCRWVNLCVKHWWKECNRIKPKYLEKTFQRATLSITYPTWIGVGSNLVCLVRVQWLSAWARPEILCSTERSSFIIYKPTSAVTFCSSFGVRRNMDKVDKIRLNEWFHILKCHVQACWMCLLISYRNLFFPWQKNCINWTCSAH